LPRRRLSSQTHEPLFRIEQYRGLKTKLRRVLPDRRFGGRRIRLYRIKRDTTVPVLRCNPIHFRNVAVAERTIRDREEDNNGAALRPFVFVMNATRCIPECELRDKQKADDSDRKSHVYSCRFFR